jgi:membrane protein implicated in regulation of membrane protease activity
VFLIWLAAAAAITGIAVAILPIGFPFQLILFALAAVASVLAGRRYYERNPLNSADPLLNDRTARLIGQTVTVVAAIEGGEGRVRVGDGVWTARGPDAEVGAHMRVVGAQGTCLTVVPAPPQKTIEES